MTTPDFVRAHRHSSRHRDEILASERCGCFYCLAIFEPSQIKVWTDKAPNGFHDAGVGQTALCPRCCIDSIIGSESGYPIDRTFLESMKAYWF